MQRNCGPENIRVPPKLATDESELYSAGSTAALTHSIPFTNKYGHANAIRRALTMVPGPVQVVVGVHSDGEIARNKGPPLFDESERYALVEGCRWVDEVVHDVPYSAQMDILDKYCIDFVVHGDDIAVDATGHDCLAEVKSRGKYKEFKRTEGISTTSLIQRILEPDLPRPDQRPLRNFLDAFAGSIFPPPVIIDLDSPGRSEIPKLGDTKVVYVGGSWDCFSAGHVEYLRRSKAAVRVNDRVMLVVGLWSDKTIREVVGDPPLLLLMERALAVIQCRHADALILNAPCDISISTYNSLAIDIVVNCDRNTGEIGVKTVQVVIPQLQTLQKLRRKVQVHRELYETRQERKGIQSEY